MSDFTPPFEIGQTFFYPIGNPRQVTVECPICAGKRAVTVILGSGEHVGVECDGCGLGYDGPQGVITEYEHDPTVVPFTIAKVESYHGGEWSVRSTDDRYADFKYLHLTAESAMEAAKQQAENLKQENLARRGYRKSGLSKLAWTVRYHRERIKEYERNIAWHQSKLPTPKEVA